MNDAFTLDIEQIRWPSPSTSDTSTLREDTWRFERATAEVEAQWEELPAEVREAYACFAYCVIKPPERKRSRLRSLFDRYVSAWKSFKLTLNGEQEAFAEYVLAGRRFVEAILEAIEREHSAYREALTQATKEGLSGSTGKPMTVEEARGRRRQLRHQVLD